MSLIQPGDHGRVGGVQRPRGIGFGHLALVSVNLVRRRSDVEMAGDVSDIQEERLRLVLLDKGQGSIGHQVIEVAGNRDLAPAVPDLAGKFLTGLAGVGIAEELVETLIHGVNVVGLASPGFAVVPLSEEPRGVATSFEGLGDGHLFGRQVFIVAAHAIVNRVLPGQERGPAGSAHGCRRVAPLEHDALPRQSIKVRG